MMTARSRPIRLLRTDWGVLFIVLVMLLVGLEMVYSASYGFAYMEGGMYEGQPTYFVRRQVVFALMGLLALLVCWRLDYRLYRRFAVPILLLTLATLSMMAVVGRWILQGRYFHSIQPVEVAKVGALVYIAVWLEAKRDRIRALNLGFVPFALLLGLMAGLILLQPDLSSAMLLIATATAMFFVAGADLRQLLISFLCVGAGLGLVVGIGQYQIDRVRSWLRLRVWLQDLAQPLEDALGAGFQPLQSMLALNRGHLFGVGLGDSEQKFVLYAPHTDCIFSIIGEELGFVGSVFVISLFALWAWRGLRIARHAPDMYGRLLAVGIVSWVMFQAALHIAVVSVLTPFTGTVLPFISYGGSSLVSLLASVGILLNISRTAAQPEHESSP
ncbi:MAG: cell division protein FtsW [Chloroflexi bacterium]|nr:cell division protein FtsW [Chloroflexota bacterium]